MNNSSPSVPRTRTIFTLLLAGHAHGRAVRWLAGGVTLRGARNLLPKLGLALALTKLTAGALSTVAATVLLNPTQTQWYYNDDTVSPGLAAGWEQPGYDINSVAGWVLGTPLFGNDSAGIYDAPGQPFVGALGVGGFITPLDRTGGRVTFYFRTKFTWLNATAGAKLDARAWLDDGMIVYLNGVEVSRIRMPNGPVTWSTTAENPPFEGVPVASSWPTANLLQGENTVAVEVHQASVASSDVAFSLELIGTTSGESLITITSQPQSLEVEAYRQACFSVTADTGPLPQSYQWFRDGIPIPGATAASYCAFVTTVDDGAKLSVDVITSAETKRSAEAILKVRPDITDPTCVSAQADPFDPRLVYVTFSERLHKTPATDSLNYTVTRLSDGLALKVLDASLDVSGATVRLRLDPSTELGSSGAYTVKSANLRDLADNGTQGGSCTLPFSTFAPTPGFVLFEAYNGIAGNTVADLINAPSFPDTPSERHYLPGFDSRLVYADDSHENYGARMRAYFVPPADGNWIFYLRSDDRSQLFLNPAGTNPSGKLLLTEETDCCRNFADHASAPQRLTAGRPYYIEALYKEGGAGDYCQVAAKLDADPTPPNSLQPIAGMYLAMPADPTGASLAVNQQPADQVFVGGNLLLNETFDSDGGGFTVDTPEAFNAPWTYAGASGSWQVNQEGAEKGHPMTSSLISPSVTVTKQGSLALSFDHRYSLEGDGWDGGQVQISVNGSAFAAVPAASFLQNGYDGSVRAGSRSVLSGKPGFLGTSADYWEGLRTSMAYLGTFNVGDTVRVRFVYAGDTSTRGPAVPSWEIGRVAFRQGATVTFSVGIEARNPKAAPVLYQWFRDNGPGFFPIPGANGSSFTLAPAPGDNGAKFKVQIFLPGVNLTSDVATLTVVQPNTPPRFTTGANQTVLEDAGPQSVLWATAIQPYSGPTAPIIYRSNFEVLPPESALGGSAVIDGGVLHLTDAANFQEGSFALPAVPSLIDSFTATFRARIGGGVGAAGEGWSFNFGIMALPIMFPFGAEEGTTGEIVLSFDSFDNGEVHSPPNVELKLKGAVSASQAFDGPRLGPPSGPFISDPATLLPMTCKTGDDFASVLIRLDRDGTLDLKFKEATLFDNVRVGPRQLANARIAFGARTGGAADNHWIDDLEIIFYPVGFNSAEAGQTVDFVVSNDRPELFVVQPAISRSGTLTYTPAPNAHGRALVTVLAQDNGGIAYGGDDTSDPVIFEIVVRPVNDCPTANGQTVQVNGGSVDFQLAVGDVDGDPLSFSVVAPPAGGTVVIKPGTSVATYTSTPGYTGSDDFTFTVSDAQCTSALAMVSLTVLKQDPGNPIVDERIVNGSFENGDGSYVRDGNGAMTLAAGMMAGGWTITAGEAAWIDTPNAFNLASPFGKAFLDLTGYFGPNATITQTIQTTPGRRYRLSLALGSNSDLPGAGGTKVVSVCAGVAGATFTFVPENATGDEWRVFGFGFTAVQASTDITIHALLASGHYLGLDAVSVVVDDGTPVAEPELVLNGSFEMACTPAFVPDVNGAGSLWPGSGALPGWTTTNAELAWLLNSNSVELRSPSGSVFLDLAGYHDRLPYGGVTQGLVTTPGQRYRLSFDIGAYEDHPAYRGPVTVQVDVGSVSELFTFDPSGTGNQWSNFTLDFTANSALTPLSLTGIASEGGAFLGLDNVSVRPAGLQLTITAPPSNGQELQLSFTPERGQKYAVQTLDNLSSAEWGTLPGSESIGTGEPVHIVLPNPIEQRQRFYRLRIGP